MSHHIICLRLASTTSIDLISDRSLGNSSPTRPLGTGEPLSSRRLGVQIVQDALLRDLAWVLHLELLVQLEAGLRLGDGHDGALHERVQHPLLDGLGRRRGTRVEEEDGALLGAVVRVLEAVKGESGLGRGDGLDEIGDGVWRG